MLLLVSCRFNLLASFGLEGLRRVEDSIGFYQQALAGHGTPSAVVMVDDAASMGVFGLDPIASLDPNTIAAAARAAAAALGQSSRPIRAIGLVGGDRIVPFWRVLNPVESRIIDPDPVVLTDNPYGATEDNFSAWLAPTLPVGRFCCPDNAGPDALVQLFRDAGEHHGGRLLDLEGGRAEDVGIRSGSCVVVNQEWRELSQAVIKKLNAPLTVRQSPGITIGTRNQQELDARYLYFNLHGFSGEPDWKGYDGKNDEFVTAVAPRAFVRRHVRGSLIFAENCYGAEVAGRTAADSCALAALSMGAGAVIAATGLAYGSFLDPDTLPGPLLANADALARDFFSKATAGLPAGEALQAARRAKATTDNPFERKTALQFVLLGDPMFTGDLS